jgi:hypothetical protein
MEDTADGEKQGPAGRLGHGDIPSEVQVGLTIEKSIVFVSVGLQVIQLNTC